MQSIYENVVKLLDDDLLGYIIKDTIKITIDYEKQISQKNYSVFEWYHEFMDIVQNVVALDYVYINSFNRIPNCNNDVALLLMKLNDLFTTIDKCEHKFKEYDYEGTPVILYELMTFINGRFSNEFIYRKHYFTEEDIERYKKKKANEELG